MAAKSTSDDLPRIAKALNTVESAGQVRAAIGQALIALSAAYKVAKEIGDDDMAASYRRQLDDARIPLESWFKAIVPTGATSYKTEWQKKRALVDKAYVVIAGTEGAAHWVPQTSNADILLTSIKEAPKVFVAGVKATAKATGEVVGEVAGAAGGAAGSLLGGVLGGLGITGTIGVALIIVVVIAVMKRGLIGSLLARVGVGGIPL